MINGKGDAVAMAMEARGRRQAGAMLIIKLTLIVLASAIAGVAQFMTVPDPSDLSPWHVIGIAAVAVAGFGGLIVALVDKDSASELALAASARAAAQDLDTALKSALDAFDEGATHLERLKELYLGMLAMRSVIEAADGPDISEDTLLTQLLEKAGRSLSIALDFRLAEYWTVTIYRAVTDDAGNRFLQCVATERSEMCPVGDARTWPEGIGPAGICLASGSEVVVQDASAPEVASVIDIGDRATAQDPKRYRSMVAMPVKLRGLPRPWGVVIATSSRADHFEAGGQEGVRKSEAVRTLAAMTALALAVRQRGGGPDVLDCPPQK